MGLVFCIRAYSTRACSYSSCYSVCSRYVVCCTVHVLRGRYTCAAKQVARTAARTAVCAVCMHCFLYTSPVRKKVSCSAVL